MKKILVIRFSSIGDIVLSSPVVRALKKQTGCRLSVLTKSKYAFLFKSNPYVDHVYSFDKQLKEVLPALQDAAFDFVVDLQKNIRSIYVRKALGVPSAAFPKLNVRKWFLVNFKMDRMPSIHVVDRYFKAVAPLSVHNDAQGLEYFIPAEEEVDIARELPVLRNGYLAVVTGGQHATKILPAEKVAAVINKLDYPVVLLGGKEDKKRGREIKRLTANKAVVDLCGAISLNRSASLIKQARVVLTNDTGLMHIAAAFRKPVVSVWGNTVPAFGMYPYLSGEEEKSYLAEVKGLKCRPCSKLGHKKCPKKHFDCMMRQDETLIAGVIKKFWERYH